MGSAPGQQQPCKSCGDGALQMGSEAEPCTLAGSQVMGKAVEKPGSLQHEDDPNLPGADECSPCRLMQLFPL